MGSLTVLHIRLGAKIRDLHAKDSYSFRKRLIFQCFLKMTNLAYCQIIGMAYCNIANCLNGLEQDVEPAAKALALSEPMAIFHPGDRKS